MRMFIGFLLMNAVWIIIGIGVVIGVVTWVHDSFFGPPPPPTYSNPYQDPPGDEYGCPAGPRSC